MWPFKKKPSKADIAIASMPQAIDVACQKWLEFEAQAFANAMPLKEKIFLFSEGLKNGLNQWEAFEGSPDALFFLIAVKCVERSKTYFRFEIESALEFAIPQPYERSDEEELEGLKIKLVDRASRTWIHFSNTLAFSEGVSLSKKIDFFRTPFVEGVRRDYPMFEPASEKELDVMIALGIEQSGTNSLVEVWRELGL